MKCKKCGAEMKEGCVYCSVCGNEAQMVPDYSILEDDYLRKLIKEENMSASSKKQISTNAGRKEEKERSFSINHKIPIIIVCCLLAIFITTGIVLKMRIDYENANSYDYQVQMAQQEVIDKNYENALQYYKTALALKPDDINVRLAMADIYMQQKSYDAAMVLLIEVIDMDEMNLDAYKNLIQIYDTKEDYDSIAELSDGITNIDILKLFDEYLVAAPVISPVEGTYSEYKDITIISLEKADIYYTMDGSTPDATNGIFYDEDEGIHLDKAGMYHLQAVCVNKKGICSEVSSAKYTIEILAPEYATITPDGGRVMDGTQVTITAKRDCSIYYTWDGTNPTEQSAKYETPLDIPYGNNILSVLVVDDKTGLDSGVYRANFIYYPN